ncbi:MAG: MarR family transcriptional regulator [Clostridiales bacterium]|nr:MarR family transcriptional regulator [Clostridiales bacterium]
MDYTKLIDEFLEMHFFNARIFLDIFTKISGKGEERVLLYLWRGKDGVLSGELAKELGLTTGRTANILKALERKKYISRNSRLKDRRKVSVFLTEKGKCYIERVYQKICSDHLEIFEYLGEKDSEELVRICKRLIAFQRKGKKASDVCPRATSGMAEMY